MMFLYYGIKQNDIHAGKWGFAAPRNGICPTKWGLATRGKPFARQNGALRPCGTPFARQNGASRIAGRHLPDKMGPCASREDICPTKRGLALCGKAFTPVNGTSRHAGRHLPDKTGPREVAECYLVDKMGSCESANDNTSTHFLYFAIRITGLSSSSSLDAISFNGPRSLPSFSASTNS